MPRLACTGGPMPRTTKASFYLKRRAWQNSLPRQRTSPLLHLVSCIMASVFVYLLARPLSRKSSQPINHSSWRPTDQAAQAGSPPDIRRHLHRGLNPKDFPVCVWGLRCFIFLIKSRFLSIPPKIYWGNCNFASNLPV